MRPAYISIDVEATGPFKLGHPMISIGACDVSHVEETFYREIKPHNLMFDERSMRVACVGMRCLKPFLVHSSFQPSHPNFNPGLVLETIRDLAAEPRLAMTELWVWLKMMGYGRKIYFVADTPKYDWDFVKDSFERYELENPFQPERYNLEEINANSLRGIPIDTSRMTSLDNWKQPHNALEDALLNAKIVRQILRHNRNLCRMMLRQAA